MKFNLEEMVHDRVGEEREASIAQTGIACFAHRRQVHVRVQLIMGGTNPFPIRDAEEVPDDQARGPAAKYAPTVVPVQDPGSLTRRDSLTQAGHGSRLESNFDLRGIVKRSATIKAGDRKLITGLTNLGFGAPAVRARAAWRVRRPKALLQPVPQLMNVEDSLKTLIRWHQPQLVTSFLILFWRHERNRRDCLILLEKRQFFGF